MTARLIFICHASTDAVRRSAFPADEPLDAIGKREATAPAGSAPHADRIRSSPELRARQTAQVLGLNAAVEPALRDCDYGRWSGQSFDDVSAREPEAVATWLRDPAAAPHGGESLLAFMQRVATWLGGELIQHRQSIVITHAAVIRAATVHAIEATPQSFWRIDVAPLSCTRLSGNNGRWNLVSTGCSMSGGK
jgi:broad specificity phosphatase PhoE